MEEETLVFVAVPRSCFAKNLRLGAGFPVYTRYSLAKKGIGNQHYKCVMKRVLKNNLLPGEGGWCQTLCPLEGWSDVSSSDILIFEVEERMGCG